jgi:hypothetical protein
MDPSREPRPTAAKPTAPRNFPRDDAVVAYLRARAPGLPTAQFDPRAVTSRARGALRRRRLRTSVAAVTCAVTAYLGLALAGPVPVPGLGTVSVPGSSAFRALVTGHIPGMAPGSDQRHSDVDRLETELLPVVEDLELSYYLLEDGPCRILRYSRGDYSEQDQCEELTPFDAQARADFDEVTAAVERSGVAVERIRRELGGIHFPLKDFSWQYNWEYVYLPNVESAPTATQPSEEWTHIRDDWWFHRVHDD